MSRKKRIPLATEAVALGLVTLVSTGTGIAMDPPDEENVPWLLVAPATRETSTTGRPLESDPVPFVEITIDGDQRRIRSNGLPDHPTGRFPNRGNPHRISPQTNDYRVPIEPKAADRPTPVGMNLFGVALNGCFFEAGTAEWWRGERSSGWRMEAIGPKGGQLGLDENNAHVQRSGAYHYHAVPVGLIRALESAREVDGPLLLGWAADGHPIYGPRGHRDPMDAESPLVELRPSWSLKPGARPAPPEGPGGAHDGTYEADHVHVRDSGDLDEFNGRFGVTPEFPEGTYHYVITDRFPFIPRAWKGAPSPDMTKRPERDERGRPPADRRGGPPAGDRPRRGDDRPRPGRGPRN